MRTCSSAEWTIRHHERQRDRLRQDIAMSELELQDARLDEIDVEGFWPSRNTFWRTPEFW